MKASFILLGLIVGITSWGGVPFGSCAYAQTALPQQAPEGAIRTQEQLKEATEAAKHSQLSPFEGRTITFEEMLKNPDNLDLNAAYARSLIKSGDFLGAATTLERILLTHPNAVEVKLLYGFVLFRLDDSLTAKAILSEINDDTLTPQQKSERESVLVQIENRGKRLHQSVTLTVGGHWDKDRNSAPSNGDILISNAPYTLQGRARVQKDFGFLMQGVYDADYDLNLDTKTSIFTTINGMRDQQITVHTLDTVTGGAEIGIRHEQGPWHIMTGIFTTQMRLMGEYFMNDYGIEFKPTRRIDSDFDATGEFRFERQAFHDVTADTTGPHNSGISGAGWLGGIWHVSPTQAVSMSSGIMRHDASESSYGKYQSNTRYGIRLGDTLLLDKGQFLLFTAEFGNILYAQRNSLLANFKRHDLDERLGVTYGVPFSTLSSFIDHELPPEIGSITLILHGEYFREFSTLMNYRYTNLRGDVLLSKRWEF